MASSHDKALGGKAKKIEVKKVGQEISKKIRRVGNDMTNK